jgi:hypothetical protein
MDESRFRQLAEPDKKERAQAYIALATDADDLSRAAVLRAATGAHVGYNSGENEWYTPAPYDIAREHALDLARRALDRYQHASVSQVGTTSARLRARPRPPASTPSSTNAVHHGNLSCTLGP